MDGANFVYPQPIWLTQLIQIKSIQSMDHPRMVPLELGWLIIETILVLSCSKKECTGYKEPLVYTLGQNDMIMFASWGIFGLEFL